MYSQESYEDLKGKLEHSQASTTLVMEELRKIRNNMTSYLSEHYEDLKDHAADIAEILDITIKKTIDVEVNVTHIFQVEIDINEEFDKDDYFFDADSYDKNVQEHSYDIIWATVDGETSH
jgi:hypothetical protein